MNVRDYMLLEYGHLPDGTSLAGERCPSCHGGSTEERTLSVSKREDVLLWKCHRASCEFAGAASSGGGAYRPTSTEVPSVRGATGRWIAEESTMVADDIAEELLSRYGITRHHISKWGLGWDESTDRLVLPTTDVRSERTGVTLRALDKRHPKSISHTEQGAMSWYINHTATLPGIIIVEDQLSAIRASDYLTSVALLGTHLSEEQVDELRTSNMRPVWLALDADAWSTAVRLAIQYRHRLSLRLVRIPKDLKDHDEEELATLFANLSNGV